MATLYVSYIGAVENGVSASPLGCETVTTSGTSAQATGNAGAACIMLYSDAAHYVTFGANPTATATNGIYVPASVPIWLDNAGAKLAAITV